MNLKSQNIQTKTYELQLPREYPDLAHKTKLMVSKMYIFCAASLMFILSTICNLQIDHQIVLIGLPAFLFLNLGHYFIQQPFRPLVFLWPYIVFRIPSYSCIIIVTGLAQIAQKKKITLNNESQLRKLNLIATAFYIFMIPYSLIDEGLKPFSLAYLVTFSSLIALVVTLAVFVVILKNAVNIYIVNFKYIDVIHPLHDLVMVLKQVAEITFLANIAAMFIKVYLPTQIYLKLHIFLFFLSLPFALLGHIFEKQIPIIINYLRYQTNELICRVHHRQFVFIMTLINVAKLFLLMRNKNAYYVTIQHYQLTFLAGT